MDRKNNGTEWCSISCRWWCSFVGVLEGGKSFVGESAVFGGVFAREYVPKMRAFLEAEYPDRREGVEEFGSLMRGFYPLVCQLQKQLPEALAEGRVFGRSAYFSLHEWEKEPETWKHGKKKALTAFLELHAQRCSSTQTDTMATHKLRRALRERVDVRLGGKTRRTGPSVR